MIRILQLSLTDFRQILREQMLWVMFLLAPSMQFVIARWLVPELVGFFPFLDGYQVLIVGALSLQVVSGIGFVIAMMLLDEKDDGVLTAIRVLPLSPEVFISYRLLTATVIGWLFAFAMLYFSGLIALSAGQAAAAATLLALLSPAVTLFMSTFGDNKVEGLAMYKGISLVLMLPLISFFVSPAWSFIFGILPDFWTFRLMAEMTLGNSMSWFYLGGGLIAHFLLIGILFHLFRRRVFR